MALARIDYNRLCCRRRIRAIHRDRHEWHQSNRKTGDKYFDIWHKAHSQRYIDDEHKRRNFGCFQFKAFILWWATLFFFLHTLNPMPKMDFWPTNFFVFTSFANLSRLNIPSKSLFHAYFQRSIWWVDGWCVWFRLSWYIPPSPKPPPKIPKTVKRQSECIIASLACSVISARALPLSPRHFRHVLAPTLRQP